MWCETKEASKWWMTSYFITKNGEEIYRHYECGYLPEKVLKEWQKFTGLKDKKELKMGGHVYIKNEIDYVNAQIKNGDGSIMTFIPLTEKENLNIKFNGWNWMFDPKSETGFSNLIDPRFVVNR
jgi:hypothetical protein